jgi:hypothetical protein
MFPGRFLQHHHVCATLSSGNSSGETRIAGSDYNYLSPYILIHVVQSLV